MYIYQYIIYTLLHILCISQLRERIYCGYIIQPGNFSERNIQQPKYLKKLKDDHCMIMIFWKTFLHRKKTRKIHQNLNHRYYWFWDYGWSCLLCFSVTAFCTEHIVFKVFFSLLN